MDIQTVVYERLPCRFDLSGQSLGHDLRQTEETISPGLAKRLSRYAEARLSNGGFSVSGWECEVETTDDQDRSSDRTYHVTFFNESGGSLGIQGILITRYGWPCLDHGAFIEL